MLASSTSLVSNWRSVRFAAGIADEPVAPPATAIGMMAEQLKAPQRQQRHEIADMQTVGRGIEAAVKRDRADCRDVLANCLFVGAIGDQPAPFQFVVNVHVSKKLLRLCKSSQGETQAATKQDSGASRIRAPATRSLVERIPE